MKLVKSLTLALLLSLTAGKCFAVGTAPTAPIKYILYYEGHVGVLIVPDTALINPDACDRKDYYILRNTHPLYKEMTGLLLAAHMSGQPLSITVNGCVQGLPSVVNILSAK